MIVSILVFALLGRPDFLHRVIYKILLMPVIAGISYEAIAGDPARAPYPNDSTQNRRLNRTVTVQVDLAP